MPVKWQMKIRYNKTSNYKDPKKVEVGSSYLLSGLSKDSIDAERKSHNDTTEQLQKAQIEWVHK